MTAERGQVSSPGRAAVGLKGTRDLFRLKFGAPTGQHMEWVPVAAGIRSGALSTYTFAGPNNISSCWETAQLHLSPKTHPGFQKAAFLRKTVCCAGEFATVCGQRLQSPRENLDLVRRHGVSHRLRQHPVGGSDQ